MYLLGNETPTHFAFMCNTQMIFYFLFTKLCYVASSITELMLVYLNLFSLITTLMVMFCFKLYMTIKSTNRHRINLFLLRNRCSKKITIKQKKTSK